MRRLASAGIFSAALLFSVAKLTAENPRALTLEEALRRSLQFNPEIAKVDASLADKIAAAMEAEVKANPAFKLTGAGTSQRGGDGAFAEIELEQPLRPSDFGLRKAYAIALRAAANLEQQAEVLRLLNQTAVLFYRLWAWQERAALLTGAREQAGVALRTINEQLQAGQSDLSQRNIFQAEEARFTAELLAVRGERAGAQSELQRATGFPFGELRLARPVFGPVPDTVVLSQFAESRAGLRRLALARQAAAAGSLSVAHADAVFPEFAPGLIYSYGSRNRESEFGVTIAGRLPIWDRQQGPALRARGALEAANREMASFDRVSMDRLIALRRQQVLNLQARVDSFRDQVVPAYRAAYDATITQFRAGQATTLQLFEVQKSLVEAQEKAFEHEIEALSARHQLEQLIGGRVEEASREGVIATPRETSK
ncbi:MAG: TolC family protein [Chthoniobacterales bacterium]